MVVVPVKSLPMVVVRSYSNSLFKATESMSLAKASPQQEINFTLPNPMEATNQISESYQAIDNVVRDLPLYESVFLDNHVGDFNIPHNRKQQYDWHQNLKVSAR